MDGTPTARLNDYITARLLSHNPHNPSPASESFDPSSAASLHTFALDKKSMAYIQKATKDHDEAFRGFDLKYHSYQRYGKEGIKKMGFSPDGWTQMTIQLAYALTMGKSCGTYESAQTRRFHLGRTECVRTCTPDSVTWVASMLDPKSTNMNRKELFSKAVGAHGKDMKDASAAMGIDRHLFGLKMLVDPSEPKPELFSDPLVIRSSTWNLSTSQIYSRNFPAYGWGPVVDDGFGVPYMIHPESLQFTVTSKTHMPSQKLIENLAKAADMMMDMMEEAKKEDAVLSTLPGTRRPSRL